MEEALSAQQEKAKRPAFAQLRAETSENDAGDAWRSPEIRKNPNFETPGNSTFSSR